MQVTLPLPPSENAAYRSVAGARKNDLFDAVKAYRAGEGDWRGVLSALFVNVTKSKELKAWEKKANLVLMRCPRYLYEGEVSVQATYYFPNLRGDLTNRRKAVLDILEGVAYHNDSQVWYYSERRATDHTNPRAEIMVTPLAPRLFDHEDLEATKELEF